MCLQLKTSQNLQLKAVSCMFRFVFTATQRKKPRGHLLCQLFEARKPRNSLSHFNPIEMKCEKLTLDLLSPKCLPNANWAAHKSCNHTFKNRLMNQFGFVSYCNAEEEATRHLDLLLCQPLSRGSLGPTFQRQKLERRSLTSWVSWAFWLRNVSPSEPQHKYIQK